jgi:hypothetical protein
MPDISVASKGHDQFPVVTSYKSKAMESRCSRWEAARILSRGPVLPAPAISNIHQLYYFEWASYHLANLLNKHTKQTH